jgi:hypothetical protein
MLIINADDWGRSVAETDVELECFRAGRITSVSAMVFMKDSQRASELAQEHGVDVGLHLNLNQEFDGGVPSAIREAHGRIVRFMRASRVGRFLYHPGLRREFRDVYTAQRDEFVRLYGAPPTHLDGHQHRHLCPNMLIQGLLPAGESIRRTFTYFPGERGVVNRAYRAMLDRWITRRYCVTDYLFNLVECATPARLERVGTLAKDFAVELETHPIRPEERAFLLSEDFVAKLGGARLAPYAALRSAKAAQCGRVKRADQTVTA